MSSAILQNKLQLTTPSCWSECDTLKEVVLFKPCTKSVDTTDARDFFCFKDTVSSTELMKEYEGLYQCLLDYGVKVHDLYNYADDEDKNTLDKYLNRIFVHDMAATVGKSIVLGRATAKSRKEEFLASQKILKKLYGPNCFKNMMGMNTQLEFGDLIITTNNSLLINCGARTNYNIIGSFFEIFGAAGFTEMAIVSLPESLKKIHMDLVCGLVSKKIFCAFSLLKKLPVKVFKPFAIIESTTLERYLYERNFSVVWLDNENLNSFMTNYLVINRNVILANKKYAEELNKKFNGFSIEVVGIDLNNYEKGGASVRCATLPIERLKVSNTTVSATTSRLSLIG